MSKLEKIVKVEVSNSIDDLQVNVNIMFTTKNEKVSQKQKENIDELKRNIEHYLLSKLSKIL